jgi:hypothetical protein
MTDTADAAIDAIRGLRTAGVQGGYREARASLEALDRMSWFDNFGPEVYRERMTAVYYVYREHTAVYEDHMELVDHARDVMGEDL